MHKSFAVLSLLATVALAQNTLIPTSISPSCSSFLKTLDEDKTVGACTSALLDATTAFSPGSDGTKNPSTAKVTSALTNLCSSAVDTACPDSLIGAKITAFYSACQQELTSNVNQDVLRNYDVLYLLLPYRTALCTKDDTTNNFCAAQSKIPSTTTGDALQKVISIPTAEYVLPNATAFRDNSLLFLFIQSTTASSGLCTPCTRKVMNAWTSYEGKMPYGPGLSASIFLSIQTDLYSSITGTCGSSFLSEAGVVKAAGGLSGGTFSGALSVSAGSSFVFASMGAVLFLVFSAL